MSTAVTSGIVLGAFAFDSSSDLAPAHDLFADSPTPNDARNRSAAFWEGRNQGKLLGRWEAEQALGELVAGEEHAGYEIGFRQGWNLMIFNSSFEAFSQLNAAAEGTQWIELLK